MTGNNTKDWDAASICQLSMCSSTGSPKVLDFPVSLIRTFQGHLLPDRWSRGTKSLSRCKTDFLVEILNEMEKILRPVQTHYTRTIQHSTLYDRHCIALLGKVFKRTIHGLYNHSTSMTKQRIVG